MTRSALEAALPSRLGALAAFAAKHRAAVKLRFDGVPARRAFWERVLRGEPGQLVLAGREAEAERAFAAVLAAGTSTQGRVYLIGTGSSDPEQLSLYALRAFSGADLLVHDAAVPDAVLALVRRDAARLALPANAELAATVLERVASEVAAGGAVCIARAGDPYADGSAGDCRVLRAAGLKFERLRPAPAPDLGD
jgi:uroporphyrin-III C-methyltransferase/precorrin-2 dehydrogenase/sirohydrochlorin ferrochelatase